MLKIGNYHYNFYHLEQLLIGKENDADNTVKRIQLKG